MSSNLFYESVFSRKKEKKIENGSKHDIRSSLTKMHQVIYNTFFNALIVFMSELINMYFKLFLHHDPCKTFCTEKKR